MLQPKRAITLVLGLPKVAQSNPKTHTPCPVRSVLVVCVKPSSLKKGKLASTWCLHNQKFQPQPHCRLVSIIDIVVYT